MALFNRYKRLGDPFGQIPDDEMQDDGLPEVYGTTTQQPDEDRPAFDPPPPPPAAEAAPVKPAPPKPSMAAGSMDKAKGIDPVAAAPVPPPGMAGAPQPPKSQAQIAFDELNALKQPERPNANKWQKLAAVGLGGLAGFNNADPRRRPMDLADAQQAVLLGPKYIKDERQYEQKKADLQNKIKTADQVENIASMADTRTMNAQTRLNNEKDRAQANQDRVKSAATAEQDRQNKVVSDLVSKGGQRVPLETPTPQGMIEIPDPLHETGPDGRPKFKAVIDPNFGKVKVTPEMVEASGGVLKDVNWIDKADLKDLIQTGAGKYNKQEKVGTPEQQYIDDYVKRNPGKTIQDAIRAYANDSQHPQHININAGTAALDRETTHFAKPHEKAFADANTQLDKIVEAEMMVKGGAVNQALGVPKVMTALVSGAGSGVRITQAELNSIAHARGIMGDIEGTLNSWFGRGKLTGEQQHALVGLLNDVKNRVMQKRQIADEALNTINSASSREEIANADKMARQKISAMEGGQPQHQGAGTQVFHVNGTEYHIPADKVAEFKRDHPNAR
jgi:hypothetical protein